VDTPPSSLRDLVNMAMDRHGFRYLTDLERLAEHDGVPILHTTLASIRKGTYRSRPTEKTLRTLAHLAGVEYSVARRAAGMPDEGLPVADEVALVENVNLLTKAERHAHLMALRASAAARLRIVELEAEVAELRAKLEANQPTQGETGEVAMDPAALDRLAEYVEPSDDSSAVTGSPDSG